MSTSSPTPITSREVRLRSRPDGLPTADNFTLETVPLRPLEAGEVRVRNHFISVDPYMRGRMNEGASYVAPFSLDRALDGGAVGEVVESRDPALPPGTFVLSGLGWREAFVAPATDLRPVSPQNQPLSVYLGTLGMTGMTAWEGLNLVDARAGDVVYLSGAAGAVGTVAGQLARLRGCRIIGSAGSPEKVRFLREACGYDDAFCYRDEPVRSALARLAPGGIDVYFDNVGGATLEAALWALRPHGRIVACGSIAGYNTPQPGPTNLFLMVTRRLTMRGMIVTDAMPRLADFEEEVGAHYRSGALRSFETVVGGIENAVDAFLGLFRGENTGKMIVDVRGQTP
jgi:NADPH-dependent curcumin reductase CurA